MNHKKNIQILFLAILCVALFFYTKGKSSSFVGDKNPSHQGCLVENEIADYPIDKKYSEDARIPQLPITIYIRNKDTKEEINSFKILDTINNVHPIELRKCYLYLVQFSNYDAINKVPLPGYEVDLVSYDYGGMRKRITTLFKNNQYFFGNLFTVDPLEKFVMLTKGYVGEKDYALVIKDLKTLQDVFSLSLADVKKINPNVSLGGFDLGKWTDDGKYFWGTLFDGALDVAYYRIEAGTWKTDIFSPPAGIPSGAERATGFAGYLAYADFPSFFGISAFGKDAYDKFRAEGNVKHFYLYNLFTKEKILLGTVSDPEWHFKPEWVSDTELHYSLPSGDQVYRITP